MRQAGTHAEQRQRDDQRGIACPANTALEGLKWNLSVLHRVFFWVVEAQRSLYKQKGDSCSFMLFHVRACSFIFYHVLSKSCILVPPRNPSAASPRHTPRPHPHVLSCSLMFAFLSCSSMFVNVMLSSLVVFDVL